MGALYYMSYRYFSPGTLGDATYAYTLAAIDIGPKPTTKLLEKTKAESDLALRAMKALGIMEAATRDTVTIM